MRKVYTILTALAATLCASAQINCQPGQLEKLVNDKDITTLTVTGEMDARDFKFIATQLSNLQSIDLGEVKIVNYENLADATIGNEYTFVADEVPTMALAGMQSLTSVVLPHSARTLGTAALAACPALTSVTMGDGLQKVGDYAFSACKSLASITIPASVATVGEGAFSRCHALTSFAVDGGENPASELTIGNEAFLDCSSLTSVNMGENVSQIGNSAFTGTGLTQLNLTQYKKLSKIGDWAYTLTHVSSAKFPSSLTDMGKGLFLYNQDMMSGSLPENLMTLPDYTFAGNSSMESIELAYVQSIGDYALYNTPRIEEIIVPEKVTFIGTGAMAGMTGLNKIIVSCKNVPALGDDVWAGVDQPSVRLVVPNGTADAYMSAEQWKEFMVSYMVLLGDADVDFNISIGDVNIINNILLGTVKEYPEQTDGNQDGEISIDDLNYVVNRILNYADYTYIYTTPNTSDEVSLRSFSIAPGETRTIDVELNNAEMCSHMQCDINLPQGLSIVGMATAERAAAHTLLSSTRDNKCRILCFSNDNKRFTGNDGAVVTLQVHADDTLPSEATITIDNVVLADCSHGTLYAAATTATVSSTTGIDELNAAQVESVRYYNVAGQESATPFSGVNMVVTTYNDGTTKTTKVIK